MFQSVRGLTRHALVAGTALGSLGVAMPALAQDTAALTEDFGNEIVVTARKRDESVQDVPITITALTAENLTERSINSLADLGNSTPGVAINSISGGNVQTIYIRGLAPANTTNDLNVEANVGVFIDGIYQTSRNTLDIISVLDIGQIEVAKGPQSALFGRSTFAGALAVSTGRPTDELTGSVSGTVGTDEDYRLKGFISAPLGETLSARVAAGYVSYDGWAKNEANPDDNLGGYEKYAVSAALEFEPSENFRALLSGFVTHSEAEPSAVARIPLNILNCGNNNVLYCGELPYPDQFSVSDIPDTVAKNRQLSLLLEGRMGGVKVTSVTGFTRSSVEGYADYDLSGTGTTFGVCTAGSACLSFSPFVGAPVPYSSLAQVNLTTQNRERVKTFSQEIRVQSDYESPFQWMFGANYFDSKVPLAALGIGTSYAGRQATDRLVQVTQFGTPAATGTGSYDFTANPFLVSSPDEYRFSTYTVARTKNFSMFAGIGLELGALRVNAEGRYNIERKLAQTHSVSNPLSQPGVNQPITSFDTPDDAAFPVVSPQYAKTYESFSPRLTVDYHVTPDIMVYASAAKGLRAGGFNTQNPVSTTGILLDEVSYDEETNWTYEVGFKSELLDRRLQLNAAAFYTDWKNAQVSAFTANPTASNPARIVQNTGSIEVWGVEASAELRATDFLTVGGSYIYTDPQFQEGSYDGSTVSQCVTAGAAAPGCPPVTTVTLANGGTRVVPSLEGLRPQRSVKNQWNAHATVSVPVSNDWDLTGRVDVNYSGPAYSNLINVTSFGKRTLTNARLTLANDMYSVALWATNLFDEKYVANSINQPRAGFPFVYTLNEIYAGEARRVGVTATVNF
ncbi:TonB-dependent receptor domain-containing protein [Croceicoccus sp. BE223]|uniref:TonB-dependent receptor n=1 Tax=Croceicoccus sp. BE223 TaxID=2817716 RepID=UPI0028545BEC|nr:TonB-dependent receptor [Croceicoccus sp. BE223]MDR7101138.1 iron complex outermembrane receptor protein [Croceicoccus sp. BE223]